MKQPITQTIGLDLGDKFSAYCVVDQASGEEVEAGRIRTTQEAIERFFLPRPTARVVMEVGTHSPWVSRLMASLCPEVYVANSRDLRFIYGNQRKSDKVDAEALARVGRLDPKLLAPVRHRSVVAQMDLVLIRSRDALVSARTDLVNSLRGQVKSWGARLPKQDPEALGRHTQGQLPKALQGPLMPLLAAIESLNEAIADYDRKVEEMAKERHPETRVLTQVYGVGYLTAAAYVLTLEDPRHFPTSRAVGPFLGLVPRRDQSGSTEKELRISKSGDELVRKYLVQCAQCILRRNSPDSDLKRAGAKIAARGGKIAKRKAVIAVARKLAVLLHALWQTGEVYEPLRNRPAA